MNNNEDNITNSPADSSTNENVADTTNNDHSEQSSNAHANKVHEEHHEQNTAEPEEKTWHNKNALKRGIAMLGYGFIAGFVRLGITLIAIFQFFCLLFAEKPNEPLVKFGQNLNTYLYQINQFLTVNSEVYPFPFADWPEHAVE